MSFSQDKDDETVGVDKSGSKVYIDYNDGEEEGEELIEKHIDDSKSPSRERGVISDDETNRSKDGVVDDIRTPRGGSTERTGNDLRGGDIRRSHSREKSEFDVEGCSLLVRNLRFETSPGRVRHHFEKYGPVRDVYLPLDYYSKRPRGFGFVEYMDPRDAQDAVGKLDGSLLDGSTIRVVIAHDRRKSPETMRRIQRDSGRGIPRVGSAGYSRYDHRSRGGYSHDHGYSRGGRYRDDYYGGNSRRHAHGGGGGSCSALGGFMSGGYRDDERSYRHKRPYTSRSPSLHSPRGRSVSRSPIRGSIGRDDNHSTGRESYQGKRYRK
ncbi:splicing factor RRM domain containing SC35-like splicing factor [Cryptosporidium bovis]|uniref:splicing factor RRM domain containing SC35-like splicing factor n=1 Tax=Cryptosporidium bovis TaxID=310047 RepID=UPI00351A89A5|nr:splicing factor RRM domain containing SC35-like splicing factor [Cryptosporidium bovis]